HDRGRGWARQPAGRDPGGTRPRRRRAVRRLPARRAVPDRLRLRRPGRHPGAPQLAAPAASPLSRTSPGTARKAVAPALLALAVIAPFALPAFQVQLTFLWIMIVFALTWDILGGQMGYNSFGNIVFFGIGVYTTAIVQIGLFHDVAAYT